MIHRDLPGWVGMGFMNGGNEMILKVTIMRT
jgi:hypothetical protein